MEKHAHMLDGVHILLSVCPKSTTVGTNLDEMMFDCLSFVMQQLQWREEHLVSNRHPMFVFVFVLLLKLVHHLAEPEHLDAICSFLTIH